MSRDHWVALAWFLGGGALVIAITYIPGCTALKEDAAEVTYGGQLDECVLEAQTLGQAKKCRAEVNARWGRDGGDGH